MAGVPAIVEVLPLSSVEPLIREAGRFSVDPSETDLLVAIRKREAGISALNAEILCGAIPLTLIPHQAASLVNSFDGPFRRANARIANEALHHLHHLIEGIGHRDYR